jgi:hypothetical protein
MRPSEPDRARWAEELARAVDEITALQEDLKETNKSVRGTISELRKKVSKILRYISGKEQEALLFPEAPPKETTFAPLVDKPDPCGDAEWVAKGGGCVFVGDDPTCSRCDKPNPHAREKVSS